MDRGECGVQAYRGKERKLQKNRQRLLQCSKPTRMSPRSGGADRACRWHAFPGCGRADILFRLALMTSLQTPFHIGSVTLSNRVVMSPLTRMRAFQGRAPGDLQVEHYRQRAGAGLILTEATSVSPMGVGYPNTPGIWSAEQVAGWKRGSVCPWACCCRATPVEARLSPCRGCVLVPVRRASPGVR